MKLSKTLFLFAGLFATSLAQEKMESKTHSNSIIAHATCMGFAFAFLMPIGAIVMRISRSKNTIWYHAAIMLFAYVLAIGGLGLGVYIAIKPKKQIPAFNGHPVIGILVVGLLLIQPALALIHHRIYQRELRRTTWAVVHVWWGRIIITLAIINGGLGLQLSGNTTKGEIAYGVVAGVMWLAWILVSATSAVRTKRTGAETGDKIGKREVEGNGGLYHGREDGSSMS